MGKILWEGTWSSGSITVPEIAYYNVLRVDVYNIWGTTMSMLCMKADSNGTIRLHGGIVYPDNRNSAGFLEFKATLSGTTLTSDVPVGSGTTKNQ